MFFGRVLIHSLTLPEPAELPAEVHEPHAFCALRELLYLFRLRKPPCPRLAPIYSQEAAEFAEELIERISSTIPMRSPKFGFEMLEELAP